ALIACAAAATVVAMNMPASAAPTARQWAPAASAKVHPGVQTNSPVGQCTANFVFTDSKGNTYIGQAAHCTSTGGSSDTNGCTTGSMPLGTPVQVDGAATPGTMVYNSWLTMQAAGASGDALCYGNDLALIKLDPADAANVNPSIPVWGGPVGINTSGSPAGDAVYTYGNSSLRFGLTETSPKQGYSLGDDYDGWSHTMYTVTPGIPGDSGSAILDSSGRALGVLSTITLAPLAASNNASDIGRDLTYMHNHAPEFSSVQLALGTEPFAG
ncbi:MAG: S1 family peptidase, partial [Frankia sp.]|nr:S1 family peptidase [Frankia sp.]